VKLFVYSPVDSAVHRMHMDALCSYASDQGIVATSTAGRPSVAAFSAVRGTKTVVWSTGLWNLLAVPLLRLLGSEVLYYLHEPSTFKTKVERGNGIVKSALWQVVQRFDVRLATTVLVSRQELADRATSVYGVDLDKIELAPLILPPPLPSAPASGTDRSRITYLGRIDERRYLQEFLAQAAGFAAQGLRPTILTSHVHALTELDIDPVVDVIATPNFTEEQKAAVLNETALVWNPKSYAIAQSGVTVDALRYGCQIVLTEGDPECRALSDAGIAVELDDSLVLDLSEVQHTAHVCGVAKGLFEERFGSQAFTTHYLPLVSEIAA